MFDRPFVMSFAPYFALRLRTSTTVTTAATARQTIMHTAKQAASIILILFFIVTPCYFNSKASVNRLKHTCRSTPATIVSVAQPTFKVNQKKNHILRCKVRSFICPHCKIFIYDKTVLPIVFCFILDKREEIDEKPTKEIRQFSTICPFLDINQCAFLMYFIS